MKHLLALCVLCAASEASAQLSVGVGASLAHIRIDSPPDNQPVRRCWGSEIELGYGWGKTGAHTVKASYQTYKWNRFYLLDERGQPPRGADIPNYVRNNTDTRFEALMLAYEWNRKVGRGRMSLALSPGVGVGRFSVVESVYAEGGIWGIMNVRYDYHTPWTLALQGAARLRCRLSRCWDLYAGYGYLYRRKEKHRQSGSWVETYRQVDLSKLEFGVSWRR
jgi:hypothetical protein